MKFSHKLSNYLSSVWEMKNLLFLNIKLSYWSVLILNYNFCRDHFLCRSCVDWSQRAGLALAEKGRGAARIVEL